MTSREWRASFTPGKAESWAAARSAESVLIWAERWLRIFNALVPLWIGIVGAGTYVLWGRYEYLNVIVLIAAEILLAFALIVAAQTLTLPLHRSLVVALPRLTDPAQCRVLLSLLRRIRRHDTGFKSESIRRTRRAIHQALTCLLSEIPGRPALRWDVKTTFRDRLTDSETVDQHLIQTVERY